MRGTEPDYELEAVRAVMAEQGEWLRRKYPRIAGLVATMHGLADPCPRCGAVDWLVWSDSVTHRLRRVCRECRRRHDSERDGKPVGARRPRRRSVGSRS